ncbi:ABC transporter substrate-binding protein [Candidatus Saccharibacteria bacterium]|nr:MAG: ABC transporter substrate-binding protein [Candidatus Saccharibacteria bacterium]
MNRKQLVFIIVALAVILAAVGLVINLNASNSSSTTAKRLTVNATFYPVAEFSRQVGGDKVEVHTLVPVGVSPHDYDPTAQDIARIYDADVLVSNGAGMERWIAKLDTELHANNVTHITATDGIELLTRDADTNHQHGSKPHSGDKHAEGYRHDEESHRHEHEHVSTDPHAWVDPVLAIRYVENIRDGLITADAANADYYRQRAEHYITQLQSLDSQFKTALSSCKRNEIATSHQAFNYLANRYGLHSVSISGLSPAEEPSPQQLTEIVAFVNQHDVKYIFFESLASPKLSETIAAETGAQTLLFDPMSSVPEQQVTAGTNYMSIQKDNVRALQTALECSQ